MSHTKPASEDTADAPVTGSIKIYNTLSKKKESFRAVNDRRVGIYLCGPTVYDKAHIGHMVGPVIFDTIKRYLSFCGYQVTWVVNITDVDDKLIHGAEEKGISMTELAVQMTDDYLANLQSLGVDQIDHLPKATEHISSIIDFIQRLSDQGFAYAVGGDVFFEVSKDDKYGKLSNRSLHAIQGEGGEAVARKRHPADFALWKRAKEGEPAWESPWGAGRPGWHIECSAMSHAILGDTFDIHGGGLDLVFPHHENEIAQSECCHGKPMATYWVHNGLLKRETAGKIGGRAEREGGQPLSHEAIAAATAQKESRSKGAGGLAELIQRFGGEAVRFFLLRTHYRSTVMFSEQGLEEAKASLEGFYRFFQRYERLTGESFYGLQAAGKRGEISADLHDSELAGELSQRQAGFLNKMDDDFNTGGAISELFEFVRTLNRFIDAQQLEGDSDHSESLQSLRVGTGVLRDLTMLLGIFRSPPQMETGDAMNDLSAKLIELLIEMRADARVRKDFMMADTIRDKLIELGVTLEDRADGTEFRIETP